MRYFIEIAYKGTQYHGWQIQPNAVTIQGIIQDSLSVLLKTPTEIVGAGRTDTGVHASFYIAHFDTNEDINTETTGYQLNRMVPHDIAIKRIFKVSSEIHSRFSALSRTYKYFINIQKAPFSLETSTYIWGHLNIEAMNEACKDLMKYSDFTSFSKLHTDVATNNCIITEAIWELTPDGLVFTITADRFLRNMVRAIVGTMLDVGQGKITINTFNEIIKSKDRGRAGKSVPAQGLFLCNISYPEGVL